MPNVIGPTGLQIKTLTEIQTELLNGTLNYQGFLSLYPGANVAANTPDGQNLAIIAQVAVDMEELLATINAMFDPDQAVGVILDQRCAINGVIRNGATYTIQNILVTVANALTLPGQDTTTPFTVADSSGNQFQLITSYTFSGAGSVSLAFTAVTIGAVLTTVNTITNIVTGTLGVTTVNTPTAATITGQAQETDASLRIRRQNSVSLPSRGFLQGLLGALIDITGVVQAVVFENVTNSTDANGIPAHSIWCIVNAPSSLNSQIANAIYIKRNAGCGMKGSISVDVTQIDGSVFAVLFDNPTAVPLYINMTIAAVTGSYDATYIRAQLLLLLKYQIGQTADITTIEALVHSIAPNVVITNEGVSLSNSGYAATLTPAAVNDLFVPAATTVYINGSHG
jgi:uncharacterized phage protein gp47/JayE